MSIIERLFGSIQARLLAVFLAITLLTVVIVIAFNQWLRTQFIAGADSALVVNVSQIADRIDEFNRRNKQVFNVGTRLPDIIGYLRANQRERSDPDFQERTRITLDSLDIEPWDEYYILSQAILDRNGINILDTARDNIGNDESHEEYFRAALLGGSTTIAPIQYRPERSGIYFYYAVPLREPDPPNTIIGVLRMQIAIATIQDIVFDAVKGQNLNVALFDQNYVRVVDTNHEELLFRSIAQLSGEQIATLRSKYAIPPLPDNEVTKPIPDLVKALTNSSRVKVTTGYLTPDSTEEQRIAIAKLTTVPWYLVVSQPTAQHYQSVQQQTTGILLLAISLTVIALFSSYLISQRITEPIRTLTSVAEQVAEGQLHIKAPITSSDEVGTLAKTFNLMTTELELAHATLEERVEKRTQELSEANEKLKHEIAERKRYEQQVLELALEHERRRILSEFIQNASHEFKTPLSIINVNSHLAKRLLPTERQPLMDIIAEQSQHVDGLINRMVLMIRLDSGSPTPLERVQVDAFIKTLCTRMNSAFQQKKAALHFDLQAAETWIMADPEQLFIALQNILDNALKYTDEMAEITISTFTLNDKVSIRIQDNGVGVPEEMQARVFERFFRADKAYSTRGFGLGLPIAKKIVENFGGTIELESIAGEGTTVTINLKISALLQDSQLPPFLVNSER